MSTVQGERICHSLGDDDTENISMKFHSPVKETKAITSEPVSTAICELDSNMAQLCDNIPGLQYLIAVDQLIVKKEVNLEFLICACQRRSNYDINSYMGMFVYSAVEDAVCCTRNCCGIARPFNIKILNYNESDIIILRHELRCDCCFFPCCLQRLNVYAPKGNLLGSVFDEWSVFRLNLSIYTNEGEKVFQIVGPLSFSSCRSNIQFKVYNSKDGNVIGNITRQWSSPVTDDCCECSVEDADQFEITFPPQLDVKKKALLLGALFLIFEKDSKNLVGHIASNFLAISDSICGEKLVL